MSDHLTDALTKEDLGRRDAAKFLNLNPCYITMGMNPKFWDSMSKFARDRIKEWHDSRDSISAFHIPDGEVIWEPQKLAKSETASPLVDSQEPKPIIEQKHDEEATQIKKAKKTRPTKESPAVIIKTKNEIPFEEVPHKHDAKIKYTDTARLKVALDIEINLIINGQKVALS